jgi:hypothetical protein
MNASRKNKSPRHFCLFLISHASRCKEEKRLKMKLLRFNMLLVEN